MHKLLFCMPFQIWDNGINSWIFSNNTNNAIWLILQIKKTSFEEYQIFILNKLNSIPHYYVNFNRTMSKFILYYYYKRLIISPVIEFWWIIVCSSWFTSNRFTCNRKHECVFTAISLSNQYLVLVISHDCSSTIQLAAQSTTNKICVFFFTNLHHCRHRWSN